MNVCRIFFLINKYFQIIRATFFGGWGGRKITQSLFKLNIDLSTVGFFA